VETEDESTAPYRYIVVRLGNYPAFTYATYRAVCRNGKYYVQLRTGESAQSREDAEWQCRVRRLKEYYDNVDAKNDLAAGDQASDSTAP
jgi:hypothetical protein